MICKNCGIELNDDVKFCNNCGSAVNNDTENSNNIASQTKIEQQDEIPINNDTASKEEPITPIKPKSKKKKKILLFVVIGVCVLIIVGIATTLILRENARAETYMRAKSDMNLGIGNVKTALAKFNELGDYKESVKYAEECQKKIDYNDAVQLQTMGYYKEAINLFSSLGYYLDSASRVKENEKLLKYFIAVDLMDLQAYELALDDFLELGDFLDCELKASECQLELDYIDAVNTMDNKEYEKAVLMLEKIESYLDADALALDCHNIIDYSNAEMALENGEYYNAYTMFGELKEYSDSKSKMNACIQNLPETGELFRHEDYTNQRCKLTITAPAEEYLYQTFMKIYNKDDLLVCTLFIKSGEKIVIKLPSGTYRVKTGYGYDWFGQNDAFGNKGSYQMLLFSNGEKDTWSLDSKHYYSLKLMVESRGNTGSEKESLEDF